MQGKIIHNDQLNKQDAIYALKGVKQAEYNANNIARSPAWLIAILSCSYALLTHSAAKMVHENNWAVTLITAAVVFGLACTLQYYINRLRGMLLNLFPKTRTGSTRFIVTALIFAVIFIVSRFAQQAGINLVAEILSVSNGVIMAYFLYRFPAMDSAGALK